MENENTTPPEVVGENQPVSDPSLVGSLTNPETETINMMRQRKVQLLTELGSLDMRMDEVRTMIQQMDKQANNYMAGIGKRLGISTDQPWQVHPDGTIHLVPKEQMGAN